MFVAWAAGWMVTSLMGPRRRNCGNAQSCLSVPGCQAQITGYQLSLLEQVFELVLCALFCSGGSQAGWKLPRAVPGPDPSGSGPLSLTPAATWAFPVHKCTCHLPPCTHREVPVGAPLYSYCLGVQRPNPASLLRGGTPTPTPQGAMHGTKPLPPLCFPVLGEAP